MNKHTLKSVITHATEALENTSDSPRLDAELLLCDVLDKPRSHLMAWPDSMLDDAQLARFEQCLQRRIDGEPIAHILGEREFWSLTLKVTPDTLIPRPDTELLVEQALTHIPDNTPLTVADLGAGSGAIALSIARERPLARVVATDTSQAALAVAHHNAEALQLANIDFIHSDWCALLRHDHFDVIASNPPYIAAQDPHLQQGDVRFDPASALVSGADGLDDLRRIIVEALPCLKPGGWLLVEHGYDQAEAVQVLMQAAGYRSVHSYRDLGGNPRVTEGQRPPA